MNDNVSTVHALTAVLTAAVADFAASRPGLEAMEIVAALGAAGAVVMSRAYPPGFPEADLTGLGIMGHGYGVALEVLRKGQGN